MLLLKQGLFLGFWLLFSFLFLFPLLSILLLLYLLLLELGVFDFPGMDGQEFLLYIPHELISYCFRVVGFNLECVSLCLWFRSIPFVGQREPTLPLRLWISKPAYIKAKKTSLPTSGKK